MDGWGAVRGDYLLNKFIETYISRIATYEKGQ